MSVRLRYKLLIYDCDGVMFDSIDANCAFYDAVFGHMGLSLDRNDTEMMRIIHTRANRDVLKHFFPDGPRFHEAVSFAAKLEYSEMLHLMRIEHDLVGTLERLQDVVALAVCTNRSTSVEAVLKRFNLSAYFGFVMTAAKAEFPKPHPDPLLRILAHYGIAAGEALFIGDSAVDAESAAAAGVPFVGYKADLPGIGRIECHQDIWGILA